MKSYLIVGLVAVASLARAAESPKWATKDLRAGIIGTDTSHVPAFTHALNKKHPEWRIKVTAAYKGGSPDIDISAKRVDKFADEIREKYGVTLYDSIESMLPHVDVVLLESVDGRPHLAQAMPVLKAGKPLFIDKPMAASLDDVRKIVQLSKETGTPFFSSSSSRFHPDIARLRDNPGVGKVTKVQGTSPFDKLKGHPDLYFYAIHGCEAIYAVMGPGCVSVARKDDRTGEIAIGKWKDGRIGVYYGTRPGEKMPMVRVWGDGGTAETGRAEAYDGLVLAIAEFFQTGVAPVKPAETIELFEFMTAADVSKERGGAEVKLDEVRK